MVDFSGIGYFLNKNSFPVSRISVFWEHVLILFLKLKMILSLNDDFEFTEFALIFWKISVLLVI